MKNNENIKELVNAVKELSTSYSEIYSLMKGTVNSVREFRSLVGEEQGGSKSGLVKLGIALILFPDPIISDIIGTGLIAAGLAYSKIKPPPIYIRDVYSNIENELDTIMKGV
ncbi:hypothetical protein KEJ21_05850 [Candidatus Bathyarchaeota archaeon]|nr:hypothetical protein [Candidatus Bathyarchaeota archaeon]MBS7630832.1 hypothetical protein [Candidatus Bathyarchaeota archaeon]